MSYRRVQYCVTCNISCGKMRFDCPRCKGKLKYVIACRKCNLPQKPLTSSAKNLEVFHTVEFGKFANTERNIAKYADERSYTYCTCPKSIDIGTIKRDEKEMLRQYLGVEVLTRKMVKAYYNDPNYRPEVRA